MSAYGVFHWNEFGIGGYNYIQIANVPTAIGEHNPGTSWNGPIATDGFQSLCSVARDLLIPVVLLYFLWRESRAIATSSRRFPPSVLMVQYQCYFPAQHSAAAVAVDRPRAAPFAY
jgi:hypothetical protein